MNRLCWIHWCITKQPIRTFGFLCDYVDEDNVILIAVTEGAYLIARYIKGKEHDYLETPWVYDPYIKSENGEFQIQISCGNTIELIANGYSLPVVDSPTGARGISLFWPNYLKRQYSTDIFTTRFFLTIWS